MVQSSLKKNGLLISELSQTLHTHQLLILVFNWVHKWVLASRHFVLLPNNTSPVHYSLGGTLQQSDKECINLDRENTVEQSTKECINQDMGVASTVCQPT